MPKLSKGSKRTGVRVIALRADFGMRQQPTVGNDLPQRLKRLKRKTENDILCVFASLREKYHIAWEAA